MKLREGNQNLQKVLKLKERLRHHNRKIMKKVKEKCSVELGELPSFEVEKTKKNIGISSQRKQPRLGGGIQGSLLPDDKVVAEG